MTANLRRIGILHPADNLESVPIIRSTIIMLARRGFLVDVFIVGSDGRHERVRFEQPNVTLHVLPHKTKRSGILRGVPNILTFTSWALHCCREKDFLCFIGVDPPGLVAASLLGLSYRKPWVYLSLELIISTDPVRMHRGYKRSEVWGSRRSSLIIIQDEMRAWLMAEDNHIPLSRFAYLPNSPLGPARRQKTDFLQKKFGWGSSDRILLHAGSVGDCFSSSELARTAPSLPDQWKLVFQTRANFAHVESYFADFLQGNRIFLSNQPVSASALEELVSSADIGIGLYSLPESPNIVYVGKSSGKLCQYLHCGLPVIATRMPWWEETLSRYHSGISIDSPTEIRAAAEQIFAEYDHFSRGALNHFERELRFEPAFEEIISRLDAIANGN